MEIGVINIFSSPKGVFDEVRDFGIKVCQLACWDTSLCTEEIAADIKKQSEDTGVRICAVWGGWSGPQVWDFIEGPTTLGIVPEQYREIRLRELKGWADFAVKVGAPALITHCGFIPENMTDPTYNAVVEAIRDIAEYCMNKGIEFWFETGQETPVVLLRTIEKVGTGNLGINLDPANLIMYGKGNPMDALDVFGKYVRNIHAKDAVCPTNGEQLGKEVPAGQGVVRYPEFIKKLKSLGFDGEMIIEREISGEQQKKDIRETIENLNIWWNEA